MKIKQQDVVIEPPVPKGERGRVGYYNSNGILIFLLTSKQNNSEQFVLYENVNGELKRLCKGSDPQDMCKKHNVYTRIKEE